MKSRIFILLLLASASCGFYFCHQPHSAVSSSRLPDRSASLSDSIQLIQDLYILASDSLEGRETGTIGAEKAKNYLLRRFAEIGLQPFSTDFQQNFTFTSKSKKISGTNVVGYLKGTHRPDKYIVVSGHYDHLGIRNHQIYYGADDDASGIATLLMLADYFKEHPPTHSLIFCAFDAEEKGLKGSESWVQQTPIPKELIQYNLNMDMLSRNAQQEIYFCGTYHTPSLLQPLRELQEKTPVKMLFGHDRPEDGENDWTNQSDHSPFHQAKIPFVYMGVEDHEDYHKPTDTPDKIDKSFFYHVALLSIEVVMVLDRK